MAKFRKRLPQLLEQQREHLERACVRTHGQRMIAALGRGVT
jgi:hypothetical protein